MKYRFVDTVGQQGDARAVGGEARSVAGIVEIETVAVAEGEIGRRRLVVYFEDGEVEPARVCEVAGHVEEVRFHLRVPGVDYDRHVQRLAGAGVDQAAAIGEALHVEHQGR